MKRFLKYAGVSALFVFTLGLGVTEALSQQAANPATGATLYEACTPCHGLNGNGLPKIPADQLLTKMKAIQTATYTAPKKIEMNRVMNTMNPQQLQDLAAYISKM